MSAGADSCASIEQLTELQLSLLNEFQHDFPLTEQPYRELAQRLGTTEQTVINTLKFLQDRGYVSRVGPVIRPNVVGTSTLAAVAVPAQELTTVAQLVNEFTEVNHNYRREHRFNLWFVVTASDQNRLDEVLQEIASRTGLKVLSLPMLEDYFIDLGFPLRQA